jgi:hypothetical protein
MHFGRKKGSTGSKFSSLLKTKGCFFFIGVEESIVNEPLVLKTLIFQTADQKTQTRKK